MKFSLEKYQQHQLELVQIYDLKPTSLHIFETIPSTNPKSWELLDSGIQPPFAVIALQQTLGRGQWGKTWVSSEGGLYLSVVIQPNLALNNSFHLTMATAWGIAEILNNYGFPVFIKWSNDLILNKGKLGGIKLETRSQKNMIKYAVIGVGINWINPVPQPGINLKSFCDATCQQEAGGGIGKKLEPLPKGQDKSNFSSLEYLAAVTITGLLFGYKQYFDFGEDYILGKYQSLLNSLGKKVNLDGKVGTIQGVTKTGELEINLEASNSSNEIVYVSPGKISLGYE